MKKIKDLKDINFEQVDFLQKADNVYRTSDYIVKQKMEVVDEATGASLIALPDDDFLPYFLSVDFP